jgi:hypothetical protein
MRADSSTTVVRRGEARIEVQMTYYSLLAEYRIILCFTEKEYVANVALLAGGR